jgi:hypothetical protein
VSYDDALEVLTEIYTEHSILTPALVVTASRPKSAPLHRHFEWSDKVAAERYREAQAALIIRSVHVTRYAEDGEPVRVRAFLSTSDYTGFETLEQPWTYKMIDDIEPMESVTVLEQMERDVSALMKKYRAHKDVLQRVLTEQLVAP